MKLEIYFRPAIPVGLLIVAACLFWAAALALAPGAMAAVALAAALF